MAGWVAGWLAEVFPDSWNFYIIRSRNSKGRFRISEGGIQELAKQGSGTPGANSGTGESGFRKMEVWIQEREHAVETRFPEPIVF